MALLILTILLAGCSDAISETAGLSADGAETGSVTDEYQDTHSSTEESMRFTANTKISEVMADAAFQDYGRLIFPVQSGYYSGEMLGNLRLTWYSNIDADKTVEIVNYMKTRAEAGETIFYDIYTDAEKAADPDKEDTGLFFFKGEAGTPFAVCNAGGGFAYVGAMHDSLPMRWSFRKWDTMLSR